jgi:ABC-2 type transport system ATP-binding protein
MAELIAVESLEKYFPPARTGWRALLQPFEKPTARALAGVSFTVGAGETLALVGANGAGKSTLLRILATLLLPTRGTVCLAGHDAVRNAAAVRRSLGFHSGADIGFYPRLNGRENLLFFAALNNLSRQQARKRTQELTDLLGLGEALDRQVRTLSTGTVQRLSLARALLHEPRILLLDEPTRSLDPLAAAEFRRFLREEVVGRCGTTLLFASHTLAEVEQLANRIVILEEGRLVACDSLNALKRAARASSFEEALFALTGRRAEEHAP